VSEIDKLVDQLKNRKIDRRQFLIKGAALGVSFTALGGILAACGGGTATPAATETATAAATETATTAATETATATAAATETATAAATATATATTAASGGTVTIGCLIPFTGVETHNGLSMQWGAQIAADAINAAGGAGGKQVTLLFEDTTGVPDVAVQKAQKFINENKVDAILGTLSSAERDAVYDVTTAAKVLLINPTFYEGFGLCNRYFFSTGAAPNQSIEPLVPYAIKNLGKSYFMVGSDYVWGTGSIAATKPIITAAGGTIAGEEYAPFGTTDFSAIIQKISAAKPDVVWPYVAGQDGVTFLKQMQDAGVRQNVKIVANYLDELVTVALAPETAQGIINSSMYYRELDNDKNKAFLVELAKKDPKPLMGSFGMCMYYGMALYGVAANTAGTTEKEALIDAMKTASFDGPAGVVTYFPANQHAKEDMYIAECQSDYSYKIIEKIPAVDPAIPDCSLS
jgi:urea transport system substrate-binding protein